MRRRVGGYIRVCSNILSSDVLPVTWMTSSKSTVRRMTTIRRLWRISDLIWRMIYPDSAKEMDSNSCHLKAMDLMTDMSRSLRIGGIELYIHYCVFIYE